MCWCVFTVFVVFFFKQKTAYEMRISDWSSDVCSSDLPGHAGDTLGDFALGVAGGAEAAQVALDVCGEYRNAGIAERLGQALQGDEIGRASCRERVCQYV